VPSNGPASDSPLADPSIHDAVLAAIPMSLVVTALVGLALSLSAGTAIAAGSVPATGTIGYALFYNPPDGASQ
jgi:hypothetical protein